MATRKARKTQASAVSAAFMDLWRAAMRGDETSLDALLPEALKLEAADPKARAARRMVIRALQTHSEQLQARAAESAEPEASTFREAARKRFYQGVLAKHVGLQAAASTTSLFREAPSTPTSPIPAAAAAMCESAGCDSPESLLDPPPDAPGEPMAANQTVVPAAGGGAGGTLGGAIAGATNAVAGAVSTGVTVRWDVPDKHGKDIEGYEVSIQPKPLTPVIISCKDATADIKGLVAGTYTFRVVARNADGPSVESQGSNPVTIGQLPAAKPGAVALRAAGSLVSVTWDPPAAGSPAVLEHWVTLYDNAKPGVVVARKRVSAQSASTAFSGLPKGSYAASVRAFAKGGYGEESKSTAALAFSPEPTPFDGKTPPFSADSLLHFDLGKSGVLPDEIGKRLATAMDMAGKWRFDYLKSLAVNAANDTIAYEAQIAQLMQMAVSKVSTAELLLSPVLQGVLDKIKEDVSRLKELAVSDAVQGIVKQVGEAAATVLSLEGLLLFLMDKSPFDFWIGLFRGLIADICCFDTGMTETEKFLQKYFNGIGKQLVAYIESLVGRIDATIDNLAEPLRAAIGEVISGTSAALGDVAKAFGDPPLLQAFAPDTGEILPQGNPLAPVEGALKKLDDTITSVLKDIKATIRKTLDNALNGEGLFIKLVKAFIVYPILGILVVSFAGGFVAGGIIGGIILALGVELLRQVAKWLAGPLLDKVADLRNELLGAIDQFKLLFEKQLALLDSPEDKIKMVAGNLAELKALLPQAFLTEAAATLGEARRALLQNSSQLALAAERALGLEHCTAFDIVGGTYKRQATKAPQLPGGSDDSFLAGATLLRDLNLLELERAKLTDGKEVVTTLRLSLFRLLGGLGDPASAAGEVQKSMNELLSGGRLIMKLSEELLVDRGFPGLYRVLIDDIQPRGVFSEVFAKAKHLLPMSIPLTLTHLGPSRTRIKRTANMGAPPVEFDRVLKLLPDTLADALIAPDQAGRALLAELLKSDAGDSKLSVNELIAAAISDLKTKVSAFDLGASAVPIYRYYHQPSHRHAFDQSTTSTRYPASGGWVCEGKDNIPQPVFYAFAGNEPGTIPLYGMQRTTDPRDFYFTTSREAVKVAGADNFDVDPFEQKVWTVCYVFPVGTDGTIKLHEFGEANGVRHFYSTNFEEGAKAFKGPTAPMCGVRAGPGRLLSKIPEGAKVVDKVRLVLEPMILNIGALIAKGTQGLLGAGDVVLGLRKGIEQILRTPGMIPEARPDIDGIVQQPSPAKISAAMEQLAVHLLRAPIEGFPLGDYSPTSKNRPSHPGLRAMIGDAHHAALQAQAFQIAKWAGSNLIEDRDPYIRGLGFSTLEQKLSPESTIFNLLPDPTPLTGGLSQSGSAPLGLGALTSLGALQYRPFENRPIETEFMLSLDSPLPTGAITDLLFDIRVRACYDENLAAAVKASRSQRGGIFDQANALAGSANRVVQWPNTLAMRGFTPSDSRTFNISMRAHRDNLAQLASVAGDAIKGSNVVKPLLDLAALKPLGSMEALKPLTLGGKELTTFAMQFQKQKPASLDVLAQLIAITPEDFGITQKAAPLDGVFQTLLGADVGELTGIGMAIIPALDPDTPPAQRNYESLRAEIDKIGVSADALLGSLLPDLGAMKLPKPAPKAGEKVWPPEASPLMLMMTAPGGATPVSWKTLWHKAQQATPDILAKLPLSAADPEPEKTPPCLQLDLGDALKKGLIYDVIFSITTKVPVRLVNPASAIT